MKPLICKSCKSIVSNTYQYGKCKKCLVKTFDKIYNQLGIRRQPNVRTNSTN